MRLCQGCDKHDEWRRLLREGKSERKARARFSCCRQAGYRASVSWVFLHGRLALAWADDESGRSRARTYTYTYLHVSTCHARMHACRDAVTPLEHFPFPGNLGVDPFCLLACLMCKGLEIWIGWTEALRAFACSCSYPVVLSIVALL